MENETTPPDWAIERAIELCGNRHASIDKVKRCPAGFASLLSFARYIAKHEEPPVDPLLIEAREICALVVNPMMAGDSARFRDGTHDGSDEINLALAALRRGIELAKDTPHV